MEGWKVDKYKVFSSYSAYDIEAKLNEHAKEEYVLALIEVVSSSIQSQRNVTSIPEYLVVMEHQPMQLPDRIDVPDYIPSGNPTKDRLIKRGTKGDATS